LVAGGIRALEITLTVPNALACITEASRRFGPQAVTGAGSVTSAQACRDAIAAGAQFIVSPIMRPEIVSVARDAHCPVALGALTPTEAQAAFEAGADFIKVFPVSDPAYIRAMHGPLPHLKIIPTSGVSIQNVSEFFAAGCVAVAVGSNLVSSKILREKNWGELTRLAADYVAIARRFHKR